MHHSTVKEKSSYMNQWNILTSEEYVELTKQRLLNTVDKSENGCWIWKGYLCSPKMQYGLTSSLIDGKKKKILAHRLKFLKDNVYCINVIIRNV